MKKIITFDSYAELERKSSWADRYIQKNLKILEKFEKRVKKKEREYKLNTGWTHQFIIEQQRKLAEGTLLAPLNPAKASLSLEEKRAFREQYPDLGQGLVFKCLTCLSVNELEKNKEYWFKMDGLNYGTLVSTNNNQMGGLIQEILCRMEELSNHYFNMNISPVFYTVLEEQKGGKVTKTLDEVMEDDDAVKFLEKEFNIPDLRETQEMLMELIMEGFPVTRGLSKEERKKFEASFF